MSSIAVLDKEQIIAKVAQGYMLKAVALEIGTSPQAISNKLANDPDYRKAREIGAEIRLEDQYQAIVEAEAQEDVSRAREGFRAAAWFAEREFPERWGNKQQINVTGTITLDMALQQMSGRVIEQDDAPQQVAQITGSSEISE